MLVLAAAPSVLYLEATNGEPVVTPRLNWFWPTDEKFELISHKRDDFKIDYEEGLTFLEPHMIATVICRYVNSFDLGDQYQIAQSCNMLLLAYPEAPLTLPLPSHVYDLIVARPYGFVEKTSPLLQLHNSHYDMFKDTILKLWLASYVPCLVRMGLTFNSK